MTPAWPTTLASRGRLRIPLRQSPICDDLRQRPPADPPRTIPDLVEWIKANPGQFTYAAPPDFTGSAFVRHVCYHAAGGYERLLGEFDQAVFDQAAGRLLGTAERD
jgi:ABC-type uncharacterized transport system YnjBCD substrate-binding protein